MFFTDFQMSRGHDIERDTYVSDLKNGCKGGSEADLYFVSNRGFGRGGKRDGERHMTNYRRGFYGKVPNNRDDHPEKSQRNNYKHNPNHQYPSGNRRNSKQTHPYFTNVDRQRPLEEDRKYSYNWRDHGNNPNSSFPSTTPLPQFTPVRNQGSSLPPYQTPNPYHHEQPHSAVSCDGVKYPKKGHFTTPPFKSFREAPPKGFKPFPKYRHPETSNEAAPASRVVGGSIADPDSSYHSPVRSNMPTSNCRGNFRGRISSRGGDCRGHSRNNRGGSRSRYRGNGPQRNNYSR